MAVALLALVGFFVALYLTLYKVGVIGEMSCAVGSCESVQTSRYAVFLGGPVAAWGLLAYGLLFALAMLGVRERFQQSRSIALALVALSGWGVLFSAWLTYLELFVIDAVCMWCIISAILIALIFIASLIDFRSRSGPAEL